MNDDMLNPDVLYEQDTEDNHAVERARVWGRYAYPAANVDALAVNVHGTPFLFLFALKDLKPGAEHVYRYGGGYWDTHIECLRFAAADATRGGPYARTAAAVAAADAALAGPPADAAAQASTSAALVGGATATPPALDAAVLGRRPSGASTGTALRPCDERAPLRKRRRSVASPDCGSPEGRRRHRPPPGAAAGSGGASPCSGGGGGGRASSTAASPAPAAAPSPPPPPPQKQQPELFSSAEMAAALMAHVPQGARGWV
jgi:hypothetical protein